MSGCQDNQIPLTEACLEKTVPQGTEFRVPHSFPPGMLSSPFPLIQILCPFDRTAFLPKGRTTVPCFGPVLSSLPRGKESEMHAAKAF